MTKQQPEEILKLPTFGRRKVASRVCVVDGKPHVRKFLCETLEEIGFITRECAHVADLDLDKGGRPARKRDTTRPEIVDRNGEVLASSFRRPISCRRPEPDPPGSVLSNFIVNRDRRLHYFTTQHHAVQIAVNLPFDFFRDPDCHDRLKRTACRQILDIADGFGCRTVAQGIETRADFFAVRERWTLIWSKAFCSPKPMTAQKFALTSLRKPVTIPD